MKLSAINTINTININESVLSDLIARQLAKLQMVVSGHKATVDKLGFGNFVKAAKELDTSLLDDTPESIKWWKSVAAALNNKYGGNAKRKECDELIAAIKKEISPYINRDIENNEKHAEAEYKRKTGNDDEELLNAIYGQRAPHKRKPRKVRTEGYVNENIGQTISHAIDMLDPQKRIQLGAKWMRASNNARIATMAISMIAQKIDAINVNSRLKAMQKQRSTPITKPSQKPIANNNKIIQQKFTIAQFINKCLILSKTKKYRNKPNEFWLDRIISFAYKEGIQLNKNKLRLPSKPYPDNFAAFKKQQGYGG